MHAADLLKGTGMVEARDVSGRKTDLIEENIMRCGFRNIRTNVWDATVLDPSMVEKADVVLADLPCSGLGIIGKKPDIKERMTRDEIKNLAKLQREILSVVTQYVKPGGTLVYSTCTLEQAENNLLVSEFLKANTEFEYAGFRHPLTGETINELQLLPQRDNVDALYSV